MCLFLNSLLVCSHEAKTARRLILLLLLLRLAKLHVVLLHTHLHLLLLHLLLLLLLLLLWHTTHVISHHHVVPLSTELVVVHVHTHTHAWLLLLLLHLLLLWHASELHHVVLRGLLLLLLHLGLESLSWAAEAASHTLSLSLALHASTKVH